MAEEVADTKKGNFSDDAPATEDVKFEVVEDEIAPAVEAEEVVEEVSVPAPVPVAVEAGEVVEVFEDKIVYLNKRHKKSMSVWQVQRRLYDLGYKQVKKAKAGYYEDITQSAVDEFRADKKLGSGQIDAKFLKALFAGDKSVKLILA